MKKLDLFHSARFALSSVTASTSQTPWWPWTKATPPTRKKSPPADSAYARTKNLTLPRSVMHARRGSHSLGRKAPLASMALMTAWVIWNLSEAWSICFS
jgi:hypothetical protein